MSLVEKIKSEKIPTIIFGAGIVGQALHQACTNAGINIECFCDNNLNKTKKNLWNTPVIHVPKLKNQYPDANFLISAADIKDVKNQLAEMGYHNLYAGSLLLRDFDTYRHNFSAPADFVRYTVDTAILCQDNYLNPDKLFLRSLDIIVTERCSLKCQDCSNLMRYYPNPKDCNMQELMRYIDKFCGIIDEINEFRVLGGEPFMNKEAHSVIKRLIEEPKAKKVVIYTNGTIVPKENQMEEMKSEKTLFLITNYGLISRNLGGLVESLEKNGIKYYIQNVGGWTDCSKIEKHNRSQEQQQKIFGKCCAKNTVTLSKGSLYRCPFSANAARLGAVPDLTGDYVNLFDEKIIANEMKSRIRSFLLDKKFLETCDFCNGRSFGDPEIQPAIQADKPLAYQKYS